MQFRRAKLSAPTTTTNSVLTTPSSNSISPSPHPSTNVSSNINFPTVSSPAVLTGGGVVVYSVTDVLQQSEIIDILRQPDPNRISDLPPAKPKAKEVYLIRSQNSEDWKCDQYQWLHYGNKSVTVSSVVLERKFYKVRLPGTKDQESGKSRKRAVGSLEFKKTAFYLHDNPNLVLVYYQGDETVYVPLSHGNSSKSTSVVTEYVRTAPSVLRNIEKQVKSGDKTAMHVYRDNISDSSVPGMHQGVMNARNVKQVENVVRKMNEQRRISKDDIYNLMLLAYHMEGFIHEITVFPDLTAIIALPEMISLVNQLLDVNTEGDVPFIFFYDTTFKLGDFYVSPLVFRNIIFEDRPIMPVAFLIHTRKKEKVHFRFFDFVSSV